MVTSNPFRQKLDRKSAKLKTTVWAANSQGKDSSEGKTDFAFSDQFLWIAYDFSVPLSWIVSVEDLGPGFRVTWNNPISKEKETAAFCIRTMFGYDRKRRDQLVRDLKDAVEKAVEVPLPPVAAAAATTGTCQRCGMQESGVYDLEWFVSLLMFWVRKPSRNILCRPHAKTKLFLVFFSNFILGNLGFGLVISPVINLSNVREVRNKGAITAGHANVLITIGFLPYALPAALIVWAIYYIITF